METDHPAGVNKVCVQVFSQAKAGQVFAPGNQVVQVQVLGHVLPDLGEFSSQVDFKAQAALDFHVLVHDRLENRLIADVIGNVGRAEVEEVGDLMVLLPALAAGAGHHVLAVRISQNDLLDLLKLFAIGD